VGGEKRKLNALLGAVCYGVNPYVFGLVATINTDIPAIWFFCFAVCAWEYDKKALFLFSSWLFMCTKEPNAIVFLFMGVYCIWQVFKDKAFSSSDRKSVIMLFGILGVIWLLYYFAPGRDSYIASMDSIINDSGLHTFGFTIENLIIKIKQIFLLNFTWIYLVIVIGVCIIHRKNGASLSNCTYYLLLISFIGSLLFHFTYLDYAAPRYSALASIFIVIFALCIVGEWEGRCRLWVYSTIIVLSLLQNYKSVDVLSAAAIGTIPFGENGEVICHNNIGFWEGAMYNFEYFYYQEAFERTLSKNDYKEEDIIITPLFSYALEDCINWNSVEKRLSTTSRNDATYKVNIQENGSNESIFANCNKVIVFIPYSNQSMFYVDTISNMKCVKTYIETIGTFSAEVKVYERWNGM